jgi:DNA-directed RNA polymerase subunit RPC12/RpoP
MATGQRILCNSCRLSVDAWSDGNPYITDQSGIRQHFYHPGGESILNEVRNSLGSTPPGELHETAGRMGNESDLLCLDCSRSCQLDPEVDELACPKCDSTRLWDHMELEGVLCPKCRKGTMEIDGPGMVS